MTTIAKELALGACLSLALISVSNAVEITLSPTEGYGVYDDSGNPATTTLITGYDQQIIPPATPLGAIVTRHFTRFDLGDSFLDGKTITGAKLLYTNIAWDAGADPEMLKIYDIDETCFSSCTGTEIFTMLGTGTLYGSNAVGPSDLMVEVELGSIVSELNLAALSDDIFSFGGRIENETAISGLGDRLILLAAPGTTTAFSQLVLTVEQAPPTVPAPTPFLLLGSGLAILGFFGRNQSRHPVTGH